MSLHARVRFADPEHPAPTTIANRLKPAVGVNPEWLLIDAKKIAADRANLAETRHRLAVWRSEFETVTKIGRQSAVAQTLRLACSIARAENQRLPTLEHLGLTYDRVEHTSLTGLEEELHRAAQLVQEIETPGWELDGGTTTRTDLVLHGEKMISELGIWCVRVAQNDGYRIEDLDGGSWQLDGLRTSRTERSTNKAVDHLEERARLDAGELTGEALECVERALPDASTLRTRRLEAGTVLTEPLNRLHQAAKTAQSHETALELLRLGELEA